MSVQTDPIPPVPEHTPPLKEDEGSRSVMRFFNQTWTRWFVSLRDKVNVINDSLVSLGDVTGSGFLSKNGGVWATREIKGTSGQIAVANGTGAGGDPTVSIDGGVGNLVQGPNVTLSGSLTGRLVGAGNVTISSTGGGGGGGLNPKDGILKVFDFIGGIPAPTTTTTAPLDTDYAVNRSNTTGSGTNFVANSRGVAALQVVTGTNASGYLRFFVPQRVLLGVGTYSASASVEFPIVSSVAQQFSFAVAFTSASTLGASTGVLFECGNVTDFWDIIQLTAGVRTSVASSGIPMDTDEHLITLELDSSGTTATGYIDGIAVVSSSVTVPLSPNPCVMQILFAKVAGTTSRTANISYITYGTSFSTPGPG